MKTARSLQALLQEVERQQNTKRDFVADTTKIEIVTPPEGKQFANGQPVALALGNGAKIGEFGINKIAHRQLGDHANVPAVYYDKMLNEAPQLLATNVNHWLNKNPAKRMVRTLDGNTRAFLSDKFRTLENFDLVEAVVPVLLEQEIEIVSCEVTERRLYIKGVDKRITRELPKGKQMGVGHDRIDIVAPAIQISNSEVGMGMLAVETGVYTFGCTNLAWSSQRSMRKYHAGARMEFTEELQEMFTAQTKKLTDSALWAQARDVVKGAFDQARFDALIQPIKEMSEEPITGEVVEVVNQASKHFGFQEGERKSILKHLIEGADLSKYGLFNAITRTAEDLEDYDRATDFERIGGKVIELPRNEWKRIAEAA